MNTLSAIHSNALAYEYHFENNEHFKVVITQIDRKIREAREKGLFVVSLSEQDKLENFDMSVMELVHWYYMSLGYRLDRYSRTSEGEKYGNIRYYSFRILFNNPLGV